MKYEHVSPLILKAFILKHTFSAFADAAQHLNVNQFKGFIGFSTLNLALVMELCLKGISAIKTL